MRHTPVYLPHLTPVNKKLIIVLGMAFLLNSIFITTMGWSLVSLTGLRGESFFSGHIYQLLSWPLVASGLFEALFDGLILWFIGSELEVMWGRKRYIRFLGAATLGGGIMFLLVEQWGTYPIALSGMGGVTSAICVAFGILFPHRVMFFLFFPIKAKYLAMILVGMNLYQGFFSLGRALAWGILGSCMGAYLWMRMYPTMWLLWFKEKFSSSKKWKHLELINNNPKNKKKDNDSITYH